jgi:C_GCAxxG_C_C family probable redox protein
VVSALQDVFDLRNDDLFKSATALAGGGGRATDGSCGAYTGAILMFGSLFGREMNKLGEKNLRSHELAKSLHDRFINEYGSVICCNIQTKTMGRAYYFLDPDEFNKFKASGAHDKYCPDIVGKAAKWAAEILIATRLGTDPKLR